MLTIATFIDAIRDVRAVNRSGAGRNHREFAAHGRFIELLRLGKVIALTYGVYLAIGTDTNLADARSAILTAVCLAMGVTSLWDLIFRHRLRHRFKREFQPQ